GSRRPKRCGTRRSSTAAGASWIGFAAKVKRSPGSGFNIGRMSDAIPKTPPIGRGHGFIDEAALHLLWKHPLPQRDDGFRHSPSKTGVTPFRRNLSYGSPAFATPSTMR